MLSLAVSVCRADAAAGAGASRADLAASSARGMSCTGKIRSTAPVAMALWGMPSCCGAVPSLPWARVMPPRVLIALRPSAPSWPVPDSTMPTASSPRSVARLSKKSSIGAASRATLGAEGRRCSSPFCKVAMWPGGMTWIWFGSTRSWSAASDTRIPVQRAMISASMLLRSADRCRTTTKLMPLSAGMASKNCRNASMPQAEAPIATTCIVGWENGFGLGDDEQAGSTAGRGSGRCDHRPVSLLRNRCRHSTVVRTWPIPRSSKA